MLLAFETRKPVTLVVMITIVIVIVIVTTAFSRLGVDIAGDIVGLNLGD